MRDWRTGDQWDRRTLYELGDAYKIHVTCGFCRHQSQLRPRQLITLQPWHHWWGALAYRLECSCCGKRKAKVRLVPVPVNPEPAAPDRP